MNFTLDPNELARATDGTRGPVAFLGGYASAWTERIGGEILAQVETEQVGAGRLRHWFTLLVPELDHEKHRVFFLEHGTSAFYPLRAGFEQPPEDPRLRKEVVDLVRNEARRIEAMPSPPPDLQAQWRELSRRVEPEEVADLAGLCATVGRMLKAPPFLALVSRIRDRIAARSHLP